MPRLPSRWPASPKLREFGAPGLVGLALLTLLGLRLTYGPDPSGEGLQMLSGWNFTADGSGAELVIRADGLSLAFLLVALFVLLAVTFLHYTVRCLPALPLRVLLMEQQVLFRNRGSCRTIIETTFTSHLHHTSVRKQAKTPVALTTAIPAN